MVAGWTGPVEGQRGSERAARNISFLIWALSPGERPESSSISEFCCSQLLHPADIGLNSGLAGSPFALLPASDSFLLFCALSRWLVGIPCITFPTGLIKRFK